jgi:hypothetical protein
MTRPTRLATAAFLVALVLPGSGRAQEAAPPCSTPDFRQFDFWIGEWEVFRPDGQRAGHNTITAVMNGCVLTESYDGSGGYHGESFNIFDASRGVWHQTWVDNGGTLLRLEGGLEGDRMILGGETVGADGTVTRHRISWSRVDGDPDRVRQLWESSSDAGETWSVTFDGEYRRLG